MNVSPFDRLEPDAEKSTVSPPSRRVANEKLVRVRVEFSKNRLATVLPVSNGSFCRQPPVASLSITAVSRTMFISSAERLSRSSKCRRVQAAGIVPMSYVSMLIGNPTSGAARVILTL
jgi:hypothetical protein